ncbi:hypothetical protein V6N13_098080 [Hibiscus sabdariffa]|uniref:GATA-type domain-containing protein n=1 Tax=Hibiscus sabdariffa TaxID=183260 RepID=A0ABR2NVK0_9ROSI
MTPPLYDLNSPPSPFPILDLNEQQHLQLFLSLPQHTTASPSSADLKVKYYVTRDDHQANSSPLLQSAAVDLSLSRKEDGNYGSANDNNGSSLKWVSSKMTNNTNNAIRVCSDCNTSTTPLWRSGPRGPKSLCNACGIRQRKARRALEAAAAANGEAVVTDATSLKIKVHGNKEMKKSRTVYKKQLKSKSGKMRKELCFKEFGLRRVFPQDVEDAAILLMELSCGFFHT